MSERFSRNIALPVAVLVGGSALTLLGCSTESQTTIGCDKGVVKTGEGTWKALQREIKENERLDIDKLTGGVHDTAEAIENKLLKQREFESDGTVLVSKVATGDEFWYQVVGNEVSICPDKDPRITNPSD